MADNTRSPEEIARLNARMAEIDRYLKDPKIKLGRGASGKFQFSKADSKPRAVKSPPKIASASPIKPSTPIGYDEDTRAALQKLGPRRGVTTESITRPSAEDAAKIATYKADQERQARNVSRGREAMMTAGSMLPLGMSAAAARGAAAAGRSAAAKEAADAVASKLPWREDYLGRLASEAKKAAGQAAERGKTFGSNSVPDWMKKAMADQAAADKAAALSRTFGPGSVPEWMRGVASGMKKGGSVRPGKVKTVMHEFKSGKLKSSSGQKVTNPKQAIAIAMSEAGMKKAKKFAGKDGSYVGGMSDKEAKAYADTELRNQREMAKARAEELRQRKSEVERKAGKNMQSIRQSQEDSSFTTMPYKKGGDVKESKEMMKKEIGFMKRKGAPKSMIKHEEAEYGMKRGGNIAMKKGGRASCYAKGGGIDGIAKKGKTKTQHFAKGGSVSSRADGIATKGKTNCKVC